MKAAFQLFPTEAIGYRGRFYADPARKWGFRENYVARVRNGFVPAPRRQIFARLKPLIISKCPFVNLPERHKGRWGEGLTAADMEKCVWVRPETVARIEFLEWTESDHLRHSKFAGLREDKDARSVVKEHDPS